MKFQIINQLCKHKHSPNATCNRTPTPPRCRDCHAGCNKFQMLMRPSVECIALKNKQDPSKCHMVPGKQLIARYWAAEGGQDE